MLFDTIIAMKLEDEVSRVQRTAALADADLLDIAALLHPAERYRLDAARELFDHTVRPVIADHWTRGTFPFEIVPALAAQNLVGIAAGGASHLLQGLVHLELSRVDLSVSTFLGVHSELFTAAVRDLGTDEQRARLMPSLTSLAAVGAFALTEPDHGSDISRGMRTTATRHGEHWVLDGSKRWIGNATFADHVLVWARDTSDGIIRGFIVDASTPGLTATLIENKLSARIVQSADLELSRVLVPEANRLPGEGGFREANALLTGSRVWVAWQAVGLQFAAYDIARAYALERHQFGKPIASFQLVQQKLVRILDNATTSLATLARIAQLQDEARVTAEHAAFAKASASGRMRESVALAREVLGGNGISTDYAIARVFADAEAVYSYEGSQEINTLVVGRSITGISAFD